MYKRMAEKEGCLQVPIIAGAVGKKSHGYQSASFLDYIDSGLGLILSRSQEDVDLIERLQEEQQFWVSKNSKIRSLKFKIRREQLCLEYDVEQYIRAYKYMHQAEQCIQGAQLRVLERHTLLINKLNISEEKFYLYHNKRINVEYARREILQQRRRQLREQYVYKNSLPKSACENEESKKLEEGISKTYNHFLMFREKLRSFKHVQHITELESLNKRGNITRSLISKRVDALATEEITLKKAVEKVQTLVGTVIKDISVVVSDQDSKEVQLSALEQDVLDVKKLTAWRSQLLVKLIAKREDYKAHRNAINDKMECIAKFEKDIDTAKSFNQEMNVQVLNEYRELCEYQKIELDFSLKTKDLEFENKRKRKEDDELQTKITSLTEYVSAEQNINMEMKEKLVLLRYKRALYEDIRERRGRTQSTWSKIFKP